jgi:hypothetical protein
MNADIDLFFTKPEVYKTGKVSTLHLLRRDIYTCLGKPMGQINSIIGTVKPFAIWPGVMLIMTGIDLISKFHTGDDKTNEVSNRFKYYVNKYIDTNSEDIYQLRNALLHGFSLYSKYKDREWRYVLGRHADYMIWIGSDEKIWVSADQLHKSFELSIDLFKNEYSTLSSFSSFDLLYSRYGWTTV